MGAVEIVLLFSLMGGTAAALWAVGSGNRRRRRRAWHEACRELGLEPRGFRASRGPWRLQLYYLVGRQRSYAPDRPFDEAFGDRRGPRPSRANPLRTGLQVTADPPATWPRGLVIASESLGASVAKLVRGEDVALGAAEVDRALLLRGDEERVLALLDAEARALLLELMGLSGHQLQLRIGRLRTVFPAALEDASTLAAWVRQVLALCERLARPASDDVARLIAGAADDPQPTVRHRKLTWLIARHRDLDAVRQAIRAALDDDDAMVRLTAAKALGAAGFDALVTVCGAAPAPVREQAIGALAELDRARAVTAIDERLIAQHAALEADAYGAGFDPPGVATLAHLCTAREQLDPTASDALQAAQQLGQALAPGVIESLDGPDAVACCEALERFGGPDAVTALRRLEGSDAVVDAARRALATLEGRLRDAHTGGLSLAESEAAAGSLSVAAASPGAVSGSDET